MAYPITGVLPLSKIAVETGASAPYSLSAMSITANVGAPTVSRFYGNPPFASPFGYGNPRLLFDFSAATYVPVTGTTITDISGNNIPITCVSNAPAATATAIQITTSGGGYTPPSYFNFPGTTGYAFALPLSESQSIGTLKLPFTITCWINLAALPTGTTQPAIYSSQSLGTNGWLFAIDVTTGAGPFRVIYGRTNGAALVFAVVLNCGQNGVPNVVINTWYMMSIRFDGYAGYVHLSTQGGRYDSFSIDGPSVPATTVLDQIGTRIGQNQIQGKMGYLAIYKYDIGTAGIDAIYNNTFSRYESGLSLSGLMLSYAPGNVSSYPGTGVTMNDLSGSANTATLSATTTNLPVYSSPNGGSFSYALVSGDEAYLNIPAATTINDLTTMSVCMWVKFSTNTALSHTLFYKSDSNGSAGWFLEYAANIGGRGIYGLSMAIVGSGSDARYGIAQNQVPIGVWTQIVATWNGVFPSPTINLYINGVLNTSVPIINTTGAGSHTTDAAQPLTFGKTSTTGSSASSFIGSTGDMQIYNKVLQASEVLYNFNVAKKQYGL